MGSPQSKNSAVIANSESSCRGNGDGNNEKPADILPVEIWVYIASLLPARDKVKLRYVSRRLQSVVETPSLWREFVWPYYHTGDEGCVNNVLKVCGQHVKRLSLTHHVIPMKKLLKVLEYCGNVIELSLPTTKLNPDQLAKVLLHTKHLQTLGIQWDNDVKHLLELIAESSELKELTVKLDKTPTHGRVCKSVDSWIHHWMIKGYVPSKLNIVSRLYCNSFKLAIWNYWIKSNCKSPAGHTGHVKVYSCQKSSLNLSPALPEFQIDFGQGTTPPYTRAISVGIDQEGLLLCTDCACGCMAQMIQDDAIDRSHLRRINVAAVTQFVATFDGFYSEHLEQLAIACPHLQRLDMRNSKSCLNDLQGLRAIASSCLNLQGLNLLGIPVTEVEDQIQLWEILSDMKLTHLAVDLCVFLPLLENKERLVGTFQKCSALLALESDCTYFCGACKSKFVENSISVLSHLPSLIHYIIKIDFYLTIIALEDILTSCKGLQCLNYNDNGNGMKLFSSICYSNLQQLRIKADFKDLPVTLTNTISSHGGLVHVVLCVRSVTSKGVTVLVRNSPNLLTFHALVRCGITDDNGDRLKPEILETRLKQQFFHRQLFVMGSYVVTTGLTNRERLVKEQHNTDLFSLWK